jgi:apolipoprotein D and lipocalin family protein
VHRIALIAAALCIACAPTPPAPSAGYRSAAVPIYSTAALPIARLVGQWRQVGGFGAPKPCAPAPALTITASPQSAAQAQFDLCLGAQRLQGGGAVASPVVSAGAQGRYLIAGLSAPLWVLWIDEGNRSMALGTPDGSFGMILSKDPIPADRLRAAREVLAWNGYDLTQFYQY